MIVECIDNSNRPPEIPISMWIKKSHPYTVVSEHTDMHGVKFYKLEEIDLASLGYSYKGFAAYRFSPLDDVDIADLVEEIDYAL